MTALRRSSPAGPDTLAFDLGGRSLTVVVRRSHTARRLSLRLPPGEADPILTLPQHASMRAVEQFLAGNAEWLSQQLARRAPGVPFVDGAVIPVRGTPARIEHRPGARGTAWLEPDGGGGFVLAVAGEPVHLRRRVADALHRWARDDIAAAVARHAGRVERAPCRLVVRDTRSQWGSCTAAGTLSFSWRLILAPPMVLDYVAAHEVAHLVELNHSARFWTLTHELCPHTEAAKRWLKAHGRTLHAIGVEQTSPGVPARSI